LIIGFSITKMEAEKKKPPIGRIDISSTPKILDVKYLEKKPCCSDKPAIEVFFEFSTDYQPEIGHIKFNGYLLYTNENVKETFEEWKRGKRLPEDVEIEIKNFLLFRCLRIGLDVSEALQLPPPFLFPQIKEKPKFEEEKTSYIV